MTPEQNSAATIGGPGDRPLTWVRRWVPVAWCWFLTGLLLGPALAPGFVLTYDMVWVPDLSLRADFFGLSSAVPRPVPSDALVAVLDNVVGGALLAKIVLVGSLVAAGLGFRRLVGPSLVAQLLAVTVAVWNPYVVERLWMGHWTVLVAYGTLPWIVRAGLAARSGGRLPILVVVLGSISYSAGLISAVALLICAWRDPRRSGGLRHNVKVLVLLACANAPWVVTGWVHRAHTVSAPGSDVFAATGSGSVPGPLAWLPLAGIWNRSVVPESWLGLSAWLGVLLVVFLSVRGAKAWWAKPATGTDSRSRLVTLWAVGYLIALLGQVPGMIDLLGSLPGGGALRDGSRMLALCAPLLVCLMASGLMQVRASAVQPRVSAALGALLVVAPVLVLPDAAWGGLGRLSAVDYPSSYAATRAVVEPGHGDALVLPFTSYRDPVWNGGRPVLDPMGRALRVTTVTSDVLEVRGVSLPGGDPRVPAVEAALAEPTPQARAQALAVLGIGWVVTDRTTAPALVAAVPVIAGKQVLVDEQVHVIRLEGPVAHPSIDLATRIQLVTAWLLWGSVLLAGANRGLRYLGKMRRGSRKILANRP